MISFITGNINKFNEAKAIVPELVQLDIDLPEIQELDPHKVIEFKLREAAKHYQGDLIVEDTSLSLDCLNGLPGPLIRWFEKTVGNDGIVEITKRYGNDMATARVVIGYLSDDEIRYFDGELKGRIVPARGDLDFGWGPIFHPDGCNKTFGEMSRDEKSALSMRGQAFQKLKIFLSDDLAKG